MQEVTELEIGLSLREGDRYRVELRFSRPDDAAESATRSGEAKFDLDDFRKTFVDDAYGQRLSACLFAHQQVYEGFERAWTKTEAMNGTLRVRLWFDASALALHALHWETLADPLDTSRLLANDNRLLSRSLSSADERPIVLRPRESLRALIVIANPNNLRKKYHLATLDVSAELARAQNSLGTISYQALVSDPKRAVCVTLGSLAGALRDGYDILYLVCHGALLDPKKIGLLEPYLYLEREDGTTQGVVGTELVAELQGLWHRPRLVFLASCQSAGTEQEPRIGDGEALAALAPRLIEMGIPSVVGMQGNITIKTMSQFMPVFFHELQREGQLERAMVAARSTVRLDKRDDWWMPVLFHRLKGGRLWENDERTQKLHAMLSDHTGFLHNRLESFVGREKELAEIRRRIAEHLPTGGYVMITGQAGQGKSSIIAKLVDEYGSENVAYHFIPINPGPDHQVGLMRNLMARLILKYDLSDKYFLSESRSALHDTFPHVLSDVSAKGGNEVIFVDGLDQLEEDATGVRDLSFLPTNPPPGIVFVLGTRPNDTLKPLELLKPHDEYRLPNLSREDFDRILQHRHVTLEQTLADRFYQAMQENALYLDLVAQELANSRGVRPEAIIKRVATNPENIFSLSMIRLKQQKGEWREVIKPILGILLVAREPLAIAHTRQILHLDADRLRDGIERLGGLVINDGSGRYALFHVKFYDYLRQDALNPQKDYLFATDEEETFHQTLANWCEQNDIQLIWEDDPYN